MAYVIPKIMFVDGMHRHCQSQETLNGSEAWTLACIVAFAQDLQTRRNWIDLPHRLHVYTLSLTVGPLLQRLAVGLWIIRRSGGLKS